MKKINLNDIRTATFIMLVVLGPFSKFPSLDLPLFNFPSFRIGAYQLLAVLFVAISIGPAFKYLGGHLKVHKWALATFGAMLASRLIGLFFTLDTPRSLLLATSLILLMLIAVCVLWFTVTQATKETIQKLLKLLLIFGIFYGIAALAQLGLATANNPTLPCAGCTSGVFGFARINLFTAEPQFFANALIPFFTAAFIAVTIRQKRLDIAALALTSIAISITFSRGAFIAISIGCVLLTFFALSNRVTQKQVFLPLLITACSLIVGFTTLIGAAVIKYNDAPYVAYNTTRGMVEQLTFGVVSLPIKEKAIEPGPELKSSDTSKLEEEFISEGVVEASQNDGYEAAKLAISAWSSSIKNIMLGAGIGNLGPYVVANINAAAPANLTVYIFYILLLAELGIVGLFGFLSLLAMAIFSLIRKKTVITQAVAIIIIMFAVQLTFFGSYINVVYIWLWLGIGLGAPHMAKKALLTYNWQHKQ